MDGPAMEPTKTKTAISAAYISPYGHGGRPDGVLSLDRLLRPIINSIYGYLRRGADHQTDVCQVSLRKTSSNGNTRFIKTAEKANIGQFSYIAEST